MRRLLPGFLLGVMVIAGIAAISTPPMPSLPVSTIDILSVPHVARYELERMFRVDVSTNLVEWETVSYHEQTPVPVSEKPVFMIVDATGGGKKYYRTVPVSTAEMNSYIVGSNYHVGIILFKR